MHHKNRVRSITWKPLKLYSRNFLQISIGMRWCAECKNGNSVFYTFWVISLWTFVHHINRVHSLTWKPLKLYSRNLIQISICMRWHAECKNGNSAFYTFWVISLGTLFTKPMSALWLENRLSYIHKTFYKYLPTWVDVQSARIVTLSFILFELFPLELCPSQKQLFMTFLY